MAMAIWDLDDDIGQRGNNGDKNGNKMVMFCYVMLLHSFFVLCAMRYIIQDLGLRSLCLP